MGEVDISERKCLSKEELRALLEPDLRRLNLEQAMEALELCIKLSKCGAICNYEKRKIAVQQLIRELSTAIADNAF